LSDNSSSIAELIASATTVLSQSGVPEARREAGSLLSHVLNRDRTYLISYSDEAIAYHNIQKFDEYVQRRATGEPLQYITGVQDFFGLRFKVTPDVLIPRPETELLVERALNLLNDHPQQSKLICDVGTGSGCISVSLLNARRETKAVALDISSPAVQIAKVNAARHGVSERCRFFVSDCFSALDETHPLFDMIVSNPPYVSAAAFSGLQREVKDHEPRLALTPGGDGLRVIRTLLAQSPTYLKPEGHLLFEMGFDQGDAVGEMIQTDVWRLLDMYPDLQGIPRIVVLQKKRA